MPKKRKNPHAVALGRLGGKAGGKKGGKARAKCLSTERLIEIARMGADARWKKWGQGVLKAVRAVAPTPEEP